MQCGAKNRLGLPCKKSAIIGKKRCANHGGKSKGGGAPKGNNNALKHGIFSTNLTPQELEDYHLIKSGSVDDELLLSRILLSRMLDAEALADGLPELIEVTINHGGGLAVPTRIRKSKRIDYDLLIERGIARIESLEKTRLFLNKDKSSTTQQVRGFEVIECED